MMYETICYKTKKPLPFTNCTNFLAYYFNGREESAEKEVEKINYEKPKQLFNGEKIDWTNIEYFYVNRQEEM